MYQHCVKRIFDILLSSLGILIAAVPMLIVSIITKLDTPGPAVFKQERIGIHKTRFTIYKFRTMPVSASRDIPTHLMNEDIQYTGWQSFLRKSSIDEIPQLFCIFIGKMSVVGPRPALWNQDDLVAERDKYAANDVIPGLTGLAQINGRDELEIPEKARLDGIYSKALIAGGLTAFKMDLKCFFGSIFPVLSHQGVKEPKA